MPTDPSTIAAETTKTEAAINSASATVQVGTDALITILQDLFGFVLTAIDDTKTAAERAAAVVSAKKKAQEISPK